MRKKAWELFAILLGMNAGLNKHELNQKRVIGIIGIKGRDFFKLCQVESKNVIIYLQKIANEIFLLI